MRGKYFDEELKKKIFDEYMNTDKPVKAIAAEYGASRSAVSAIVQRMGGELRRPRSGQPERKKCKNCKRVIELKGARFCPYCGADIRDEREVLDERLSKLFRLISYLPANERDEAQEIIKDASTYIKRTAIK